MFYKIYLTLFVRLSPSIVSTENVLLMDFCPLKEQCDMSKRLEYILFCVKKNPNFSIFHFSCIF